MEPHIIGDTERKKNQEASVLFYDIESYVNEQSELEPNLVVRN